MAASVPQEVPMREWYRLGEAYRVSDIRLEPITDQWFLSYAG